MEQIRTTMNPNNIKILLETLYEFYGKQNPTRNYDAMEELISCILSQNSNDKITFPTFDQLRIQYPTWEKLVQAGYQNILEQVKAVGLAPTKTKNILQSLKMIYEKTGDYSLHFLSEYEPLKARQWLEQLPGVGPKTATIVLTFGLGMDLIPVDTHIHRISKRLGIIPEKMDANTAHDYLLQIIPKPLRNSYHQQLIIHGRNLCTARNPKCNQCPISKSCLFEKNNSD